MTRIHFMKHLVLTTIFSGLCINSISSHEYNQQQSQTHSSTYEQQSSQSQIKVSGWYALIPAFISWLFSKKETAPSKSDIKVCSDDSWKSGDKWHYDENNVFCAWSKPEDSPIFQPDKIAYNEASSVISVQPTKPEFQKKGEERKLSFCKKLYVRTILLRSSENNSGDGSTPSFDVGSGPLGDPDDPPDPDDGDNDDDDLVKTIKKLIRTRLHRTPDTDQLPAECMRDPLYRMLSEEQKQELTANEQFIALLIQRREEVDAFTERLNMTSEAPDDPEIALSAMSEDVSDAFQDLLYEVAGLTESELADKFIDLKEQVLNLPDCPRTEAIKTLMVIFDTQKSHDQSLDDIIQQYADEADGIADHTHLAHSRENRSRTTSGSSVSTQEYDLPSFLERLLEFLGLDVATFSSCTGNEIQQKIHSDILESLAAGQDAFNRLEFTNPLAVLMAKLARLGIVSNKYKDYNTAMLMADVTAGLVDIGNGIGRAARHEATDVFGWFISLGFAGVAVYASPEVSLAVTGLCLLWLVGNFVFQASYLGYQSQYDEKMYNERVKAIKKSITLGNVVELLASFAFSCVRDHFVESALKSFASGMLKRSFLKQLNEVIEQSKKVHPEKPKSSAAETAAHQAGRVHPKVPKAELDRVAQEFLHELKAVEHLLDERIRGRIKDLNLWHIFAGDVGKGKITGYHSTYYGARDIVEELVRDPITGAFKARWTDGVNVKPSTFFPEHWGPEIIKQKALEILCTGEVKFRGNNGFVCGGFTKEGIYVELKVTGKGVVETFHPILEKMKKHV